MGKLTNKFGPWVVGEEFFNRVVEVQRLTQILDENNNVLLVAPRRIGKTSLVRETFRRLDDRDRDYPVFVDVQDCRTPDDVIVALCLAAQPYQGLAKKIKDAFSTFMHGVRSNIESVGTAELLEIRLREGISGDWQAKARKLVSSLAEADRPIAICLDELPIMLNRLLTGPGDSAQNRASAELFLSWLRGTVTAHPDRIRWIICGSIGLEPILARHNLSFTVGNLRAFHLSPWDRVTADACLQSLAAWEGHAWPEESRLALLDKLAYYIPHHVQMYFGHVMDDCRMRGKDAPTAESVVRVWDTHMLSTRGHAELADYEERLLRVLDAKDVELALALLTEAAVVGRLTPQAANQIVHREQLDKPDKALRDVLHVLDHDGYLKRQDPTDAWLFVSPLLRDWWRRRFGTAYKPLVSPVTEVQRTGPP